MPVFCNVQFASREDAVRQATGDLTLQFCRVCTHVFNSTFDESRLAYGEAYENSLHYSPAFGDFARSLATRLISQYQLKHKRVVDIGCGKGDFLSMLCELGENTGFGFDKSYQEGRASHTGRAEVTYYKEHFGPQHASLRPDLVTCRHVLEHIREPAGFLETLTSSLADARGCGIYFEVPNALFTLRDLGIWDLIYEHCQYFTANSLCAAFARADLTVVDVYESFAGQYLGVEARMPGAPTDSRDYPLQPVAEISEIALSFGKQFASAMSAWEKRVAELRGVSVVWGAGSKGVTFVNLLNLRSEIACIVDVNPHKTGMFTPVTAHRIVAPEALKDIRPDNVLIMNPVYRDEIASQLRELGISAQVIVVD